jgi:hypothetical protein
MKWNVSFAGGAFVWVSVAMIVFFLFCSAMLRAIEGAIELRMSSAMEYRVRF